MSKKTIICIIAFIAIIAAVIGYRQWQLRVNNSPIREQSEIR